ncbi:hypothetical protein AB6F62_09880 [Providencia huaxiensis]|uniref:hypothetical protein n=1 Tax=Providencia huaxiensis TaxID=2027290 RepID=UPI0034DD8253
MPVIKKIIIIKLLVQQQAAMAAGLGAINHAPISGFYGWLVVDKMADIYIIGCCGSAIITIGSY